MAAAWFAMSELRYRSYKGEVGKIALNLQNGYLVCYTISEQAVLSMVTTMLVKAFETIADGTGLIIHSDQGR